MSQPASGQTLAGRTLAGRYRLEQTIARGGMATVWLGRDELLGRRVAVKTLHPELAVDEALRGRFRQEAVAAAALSHPNIVPTFDTGDDGGIAFIVMELVEGESLRQLLDRKRVLDPTEAVDIARQVAAALEHAHRQGIVHRDIKPANVLVPREGPVKVTDFGIAKATGGADFTRTGTVVGTARYLAPEQVRGQPTDARTDVYALGLVLYEMLAGRPAYHGDTEMATALARLAGPPPPLAQLRPDVPAALASVLEAALRPEPAQRIPSAAAFEDALLRAARGVPIQSPTAGAVGRRAPGAHPAKAQPTKARSATPRPAPRKERHPWRVVGFLVFLALLGTAAGLITAAIVADDGSGGQNSGSAPQVAGIRDFDPFGGDGENADEVQFAVDGDPQTAWRSETYVSRDVGGKAGVGLALELTSAADVRTVEIDGEPGASVEIYVAPRGAERLDGWGPVRGEAHDLPAHAVVTLDEPTNGQAVLVWFVRTPPSRRIEVQELRVG
ncbi:MAG: hypothetical protein AMXMBFR46_22940 [Acidimicrobiia bacterium]